MQATRKLKGMTLTELLVVLAILGILLLLAFPVLKPLFTKAHAMEAQTNLKHLARLQETYFLQHTRYTDRFIDLGFEQAALKTSEGESGTANYRIEIIEVNPADFRARATAITDFDGDGSYNVWEINKSGIPQEVTPD